MDHDSFSPVTEARTEAIIKSLLSGCLSNTAVLMPDGSYQTGDRQIVAIHPSSVLFGKKVEAIVFSEFVYTTKAYARNVSSVRMTWMSGLL